MARALILTEAKAEELGLAGEGPFTFGGAFPGEYLVGRPLELAYLGFGSDEEAEQAFHEAFVDVAEDAIPLELVDVTAGDGPPIRVNHALSEGEQRAEDVEEAVEEVTTGKAITTHADADAIAAELGFSFPADPRPKLEDKVSAIEAIRSGTAPADALAALTPEEEAGS